MDICSILLTKYMDRKKFIRNLIITGIGSILAPQIYKVKDNKTKNSTHDRLIKQVGVKY